MCHNFKFRMSSKWFFEEKTLTRNHSSDIFCVSISVLQKALRAVFYFFYGIVTNLGSPSPHMTANI